jgi:ribonuclease VapC
MMLLDSSAILAIIFNESEADAFASLLSQAKLKKMSAPNFLEACMASTRLLGGEGCTEVKNLIEKTEIEILTFDANMANIAIEAYIRFGKGRVHPAQLNFGDCIAYAASKADALPLLFKGDDFRKTDVWCAT